MVNTDGTAAATQLPTTAFQATSVTDDVYVYLRKLIMNGLASGHSLRLNELATELGVSTTPVRMALERLTADGLVIQENRRTCRVAPLSVEDFLDIYTIRCSLEGTAARLGAPNLTDGEISEVRAIFDRIEQIASYASSDVDEYLAIEWRMHEICYRASASRRLFNDVQSYRRLAERYFRLILTKSVNLLDDLEGQREFLGACVARDGAAAERVAVALLGWTVDHMAPMLVDSAREMADERN